MPRVSRRRRWRRLETSRLSLDTNRHPLLPPRRFANWNGFGCNYDDATLRGVADALVATGLAARGYQYVLVQECIVPAGARNATTHELMPDAAKFPHGLAALADYFHSLGLKAGIYTDGAQPVDRGRSSPSAASQLHLVPARPSSSPRAVAHLTCAGYEGSGPGPDDPAGHWPLDALTFARWGFDLIEADFCNTAGVNRSAYSLYAEARDAIAAATAATGRPIVFCACAAGRGTVAGRGGVARPPRCALRG